MVSRAIVIALILFSAATTQGAAAGPGTGLGIILGEPTGISFKTWFDASTAIDAAAAWSFSENDSFQLHADYLLHPFAMPKPPDVSGSVRFFYGFGARLKLREDDGNGKNDHDDLFGMRFPVGFSHLLRFAPMEFFAELVPILDLVPDTNFDLNGAIGARFYFK